MMPRRIASRARYEARTFSGFATLHLPTAAALSCRPRAVLANARARARHRSGSCQYRARFCALPQARQTAAGLPWPRDFMRWSGVSRPQAVQHFVVDVGVAAGACLVLDIFVRSQKPKSRPEGGLCVK